MPIDHSHALVANPGGFIANNTISLSNIAGLMGVGGIPALNNMRVRLTLSQATVHGAAAPNTVPELRVLPGLHGGGLATIPSYFVQAGNGGDHVNVLPYADIRQTPWPGEPRFLFTIGMNGCSLIVASAVPAAAPPLAAWHYRVMHDHSHYNLAHWHAAGYTVRFASYADPAEPGPIPLGFFPAIRVRTYNPNAYPWFHVVGGVVRVRVVTNFLHHDGTGWQYHSRHFHDTAGVARDVDAPPGGGGSSTQSLVM